jgi:hypothetical protein
MGVLNEKRCKNIYNNEANQNNCKETDSSIIECLKKEGPTSEASNPTTKFHGPKDTKNLYTNEEFKWDIQQVYEFTNGAVSVTIQNIDPCGVRFS